MNKEKQCLHIRLPLAIIFIFFLLLSTALATDNLANYYVDWQSKNPGAGGHLSINCPKVLEQDQTYQVKLTLSMEWMDWGDSAEFGTIQWLINNGSDGYQLLGYSVLNSSLKLHESMNVISHWSLTKQQVNATGKLLMNTTIVIYNSLQPSDNRSSAIMQAFPTVEISLKEKSNLTISSRSESLLVGDPITIDGYLFPAEPGALINITYTKPNGNTFARSTATTAEGNFSDKLIADTEGTWLIQASWKGTEYVSADPSNVLILMAKNQIPLLPFAAVGIVLAVVFLPFLIQRKRKFEKFKVAKLEK